MSDPKQLRFQFVVDEASLQKTRQLIREITSDLTKLNNEAAKIGGGMGGMGGGGGGVGITAGGRQSPEQQRVISKAAPAARPLVQNFLDQKNLFKGVAEGSRDSMRMMTDALKRAVADQRQEVQRLQQSLEALASTYNKLGGAGGGRAGSIQSLGIDIQGKLGAARERLVQLENMGPRSELMPEIGWPDDPRWGRQGSFGPIRRGRGEVAWGNFKNAAGFGEDGPGWFGARKVNPKVMTAMRIGGLAMAGIDGAIDQSLAGATGFAAMGARRGDIASGQMQRLLGGDAKLLFALNNLSAEGKKDMMDRVSSRAAQADVIRNSLGNTIANAPIIGGFARAIGIGGGKGANGGIGGAWSTAEQQSYLAEEAMKQAEAEVRSNPLRSIAMDRFSGELGQRISAGRIMGYGRNLDPRTGLWVDSFGRRQNALEARGYSVSEEAAAKTALQGMAGERFGFRHRDAVMRANAQGLGGYAQLLAAGARAGMGDDSFARFAIGGGIDQTAGIHLGSAIVGSGFDPRGTTTGMGVLGAAQNGFNWSGNASDFNQVEKIRLGMGLGDSLTTGSLDPYQKGRNLISAVRNNPGLSIYGQDYLANGMSFKQMMDIATLNSPMTATGDALGITPQMIERQLKASANSMIDRFKDDPTKTDPMTQTIRALRAQGGDITGFLGGLSGSAQEDARRNLKSFFGIQSRQGEAAGEGFLGLFEGFEGAAAGRMKKGNVGRGFGQTEKDLAEGMAGASSKVTDELENLGKNLNETFQVMEPAMGKLATFSSNLGASTEIFIESLTKLTTAIKASTDRLGGSFRAGAGK